ncbi:MAG: GTPase Era [Deltaproteobacteria bacterium]|nr:MAG: GTPase Era [Deltaproteobacteria bacterium]
METEYRLEKQRHDFRSGFVALLGRPNVGKSTLLNRLVGHPVAIATAMPQTTRSAIRGVVHMADSQIVLVDTPGLHVQVGRARALNQQMNRQAEGAASDVDVVLLMVEAIGRGFTTEPTEEDRFVLDKLGRAGKPTLLVVNKVDLLKDSRALEPVAEFYMSTGLFEGVLALSALTGEGVERLLETLKKMIPAGPAYFPPEMFTDQPEQLLAAERIREQIILQTGQEVPFSTAVSIESFEPKKDITVIGAVIYCERESQRGILIGRKGARLKSIGMRARESIEKILGKRVYLELMVKVKSDWTKTSGGLRAVGMDE